MQSTDHNLSKLILIFCLYLAFGALTVSHSANAETLATINGVPINTQRYYSRYQSLLETHPRAKGNRRLEDHLAKRALLPLVIEELLRQEAQKLNFPLEQITYKDPIAQLAKTYRSESRLQEYMRRLGETEESLKLKKWSDKLTESLMRQQQLLKVTDEELRAEYHRQEPVLQVEERIRASQLLIKLPKEPTKEQVNQAFNKIQEIHKLTTTEPFEVLVQRYSEGALRSRGGDIGFVARGDLLKVIEQVIWSLKENEISTPVRSSYGWHLIKRGAYQAPHLTSFEDVKDTLKRKLEKAHFRRGKRKYIKSLWRAAKIDSTLPLRY